AAKNLVGSATRTVGVVLPHFSGIFFSDYYSKVLAGVADAVLEAGYRFKLVMLRHAEGPRWDRHDFRSAEGVDALVVTHWPNFFSKASAINRLTLPCVVVNDAEPGVRAHFAGSDNRMGGYLAAQHLCAMGHRRVLLVTGPEWSSDSRLRVEGFRAFFREAGVRAQIEAVSGAFHESDAAHAVGEFFSRKKGFTAVFACNDLMACGALARLAQMGIDCPSRVSVVGYDDDARAASAAPPLTTVRVPLYEIARESVRRLIDRLEGRDDRDRFFRSPTVMPVELVVRQSVRPLRADKMKKEK
ncbi:MAG TPA: LacI family DNA-binding transcriptional regulator, partial [Candidatus Eisenbacteria bacterium]|nr:LacI family DNA-binding transcriptional regulator [Candidatus Eisenbacteria bacterium]